MEEYDDFGNIVSRDACSPAEDSGIFIETVAEYSTQEDARHAFASNVYGPDVEVVVAGDDTPGRGVAIVAPVVLHRFEAAEHSTPLPRPGGIEHMEMILGAPSRVRSVAVAGALQHGKTSLVDMLLVASHETLSLTHFRAAGEASAIEFKEERGPELARHMDRTDAERRRGISLFAKPATMVLPNARGVSCVLNIVDTPGHVELAAETSAGLELADGVLLVVDAAEGVTLYTRRVIAHAVRRGMPLVLVLTKVERLIVELRLPPADAHLKLRHVIDTVNTAISEHGSSAFVTPLDGSVLFSSARAGWVFSLESFARAYLDRGACTCTHSSVDERSDLENVNERSDLPRQTVDGDTCAYIKPCPSCEAGASAAALNSMANVLATRLWGDDWVYDGPSNTVQRRPSGKPGRCAFVQLVLEPLYKIYGAVLSEERSTLEPMLAGIGIRMSSEDYALDALPMLRRVFALLFSGHSGRGWGAYKRIDAGKRSVLPKSFEQTHGRILSRVLGDSLVESVFARVPVFSGKQSQPLRARIVKLLPRLDGTIFDAVVRVDSGVLQPSTVVHVHPYTAPCGPFGPDGPEKRPMVFEISEIALAGGRDRVPLSGVPAGCWALVPGLSVVGVIVSPESVPTPEFITAPFVRTDECFAAPIVRLPFEPLVPKDALIVAAGLGGLLAAYSGVRLEAGGRTDFGGTNALPRGFDSSAFSVSGSTALLGAGELALDAAMHDLRRVFAHADVRVADPVTVLRESCASVSRVPCGWSARVGDAILRVAVIADPLDERFADALEDGFVLSLNAGAAHGQRFDSALIAALADPHGAARWDALAARSVLAFGPDPACGPCVLLDDTLVPEAMRIVRAHATALVSGFRRATARGPMLAERVHGVRFRIVSFAPCDEAHLAENEYAQSLEDAMLNACHGALLTATPRIAEPIMRGEVRVDTRHAGAAKAVAAVLARRRGHVLAQNGVPATPCAALDVMLPAMDSFGLEADVRLATAGASHVQIAHAFWRTASGDPLDEDIRLVPLAAAPAPVLGRDYMLKTRRRKHMVDQVPVLDRLDIVSRAELCDLLAPLNSGF